jgi:ABC-2 type transport system ATP-binding protein
VSPDPAPASTPRIVELQRLVKRYGTVPAIADLSLALDAGPVGLLGPNGAGKTTLIKILLGLLRPDSGEARIAGHDPVRASGRLSIRRVVGYMPENDCLLPGLTGLEVVSTLARLTGLSRSDAISRAHEVLDYVGIEEARYRLADGYSTGMKQRLKLAQALVHDPELLLLDEPTSGLDPKGRRHMLDLVHDLGHRQGKSLLLCSHLLPDVERTCESVVVLREGKVVVSGPIRDLTRVEGRKLRLEVAGDRVAFLRSLVEAGVPHSEAAGGSVDVVLADDLQDADPLFLLAARAGACLRSVAEVRSSLEDVFLAGIHAGEPT